MGYVWYMSTHIPLPELTNELLGDLLDPSVGPIDICVKYTLTILQVQALVRTEEFRTLRDAVVEIAEARFSLQLPRARQTALDQLTRITSYNASTPQHAETIRKAVGMILRWKPAPAPARDEPVEQNRAETAARTQPARTTDPDAARPVNAPGPRSNPRQHRAHDTAPDGPFRPAAVTVSV